MANPFIHVFAGDVARLGVDAHATADQHQAHVGRLMSETENLGASFQCTAANVNQQGVVNAADRIRAAVIERGRNEGDGLHTSSNLINGSIADSTHVMMAHLNV